MIQMDVPAAFVFSQVFAYAARGWLAEEEPSISGRYTALATAYSLGVIGSCGLYLYSGWPEWEMMYWLEPVQMSTRNFGNALLALVGPLFLVALGVAGAGVFLLAHRWIRLGHPRRVLAALWTGVALSLGMVLLTPSAPMYVGHYSDYHAYLREALQSGRAWEYGILSVGPWTVGVPFAASGELLAAHRLITFFDPAFFLPWAIDIAVFLSSAVAVALWFRRHRPSRVPASANTVKEKAHERLDPRSLAG